MKLIKNELIKIFKKRSTYVFLFIIFSFIFYTNYFYKYKVGIELRNIETIFFYLFSEYELLIIIFCAFITSSIFDYKGTLKQLLLFPYSRSEILMSKFISSVIMLLFVILYIFVFEIIISKIFFTYNTFSISVFINNSYLNGYIYLLKAFISKLPMYIIYIIMSIFLCLVINNSLSNIILLINYIIITPISSNIKIFDYFINSNCDFSMYLFTNIPIKVVFIYIIYFLIFLSSSFIIFNKKNI